MGLGRDLRRARSLPLRSWADLATAAIELGLARIRLAGLAAAEVTGKKSTVSRSGGPGDERVIDRVAFAIPRMGARVPWKGTCLVQALAAQRWLARRGIASEIVLGARKAGDSGIDAHAWLECEGRVVVGGDVADYERFKRSPPRPR